MLIHCNGTDGKIHVHACAAHPTGSATGGSACFWDDDHNAAFRLTNKAAMITALTAQATAETDPAIKTRVQSALTAAQAV